MQFEFSDSIGGYVKSFDKTVGTFILTTSDGRDFSVKLTATLHEHAERRGLKGQHQTRRLAFTPERLGPGQRPHLHKAVHGICRHGAIS